MSFLFHTGKRKNTYLRSRAEVRSTSDKSGLKRELWYLLLTTGVILLYLVLLREKIGNGLAMIYNLAGERIGESTGFALAERSGSMKDILYIVPLLPAFSFILHRFSKNCKFPQVRMIIILPVILFFVYGIVAVASFPEKNIITEASYQLRVLVNRIRYDGSSIVGGDDFSNIRNYENNKSEALRVVMENPGSYYLRGFIGNRYTKRGWRETSGKRFYENRDLFLDLHEKEFYSEESICEVARVVNKNVTKGRVIINNIDAPRGYCYTPYELCDGDWKDSKRINGDEGVYSKGVFGEKTSTYYAAEPLIKNYTTLSTGLYKIEQEGIKPESFLNLEAHYNEFVYESYLDIPDNIKNILETLLGDIEYEGPHLSYGEAKSRILSILGNEYEYDSSSTNNPAGNDLISSFLQETKKGASVHFSSAAVMMFRYFNIPARYVEGYLITPEDVDGVLKNQEIRIDKSHAHAWAEFYQDGLGWIPFEVTPAFIGVMESADDLNGQARSNQNQADNKNENKNDIKDRNTNRETGKRLGIDESSSKVNSNYLIIIFICILIIFLFIRRYRKLFKLKKVKYFVRESRNKSAVIMFEHTIKLLRQEGYIGNGNQWFTDDSIQDILLQRFEADYMSKHRKSKKKLNIMGEKITQISNEFLLARIVYFKSAYKNCEIKPEELDVVKNLLSNTICLIKLSI